jgi:hypothetical protein
MGRMSAAPQGRPSRSVLMARAAFARGIRIVAHPPQWHARSAAVTRRKASRCGPPGYQVMMKIISMSQIKDAYLPECRISLMSEKSAKSKIRHICCLMVRAIFPINLFNFRK